MKIRPTTVLFVLASVTAFSASARADAPESRVSGPGNPAQAGPRVELSGASSSAGGQAVGVRRTRRITEHRMPEHRVLRERTQSARRDNRIERRPGRRAVSELAAHDDGSNAASIGHKTLSASSGILPGSSVVVEARRWIGTNPTGRKSLWCARFMNFVLKRVGLSGTSSDMAKSFASYGKRLSGPKIGAIAVMSRGRGGGHVGVVSGFDSHGNPIVISGNHSRRVAEAVYSRSRIYAYVAPGK